MPSALDENSVEIKEFSAVVGSEQGTIYKIKHMVGAGTTVSGEAGFVPAPDAGDDGKFLRGDGTWATAVTDVSDKAPKANPVFTGSISMGRKENTTVGTGSVAVGNSVTASGAYSFAEGDQTAATGTNSHAECKTSTASGNYSHAEGWGNAASGMASHAEGRMNGASGTGSHAEGYINTAKGDYAHVGGMLCVIDDEKSFPMWVGGTSYEVGDIVYRSGVVGKAYVCTTANSDASFDNNNWSATTKFKYAEIIGNGTANNSAGRSNARALDWNGNEYLKGDVYVGCNADSTGGTKLAKLTDIPAIDSSPTSGSTNLVTSGGVYTALDDKAPKASPVFTGSISRGRKANTTIGSASVAVGYNVTATGTYAHAEGNSTTASGEYSHAEGNNTTASGNYSHAEGLGTISSRNATHAEGYYTNATAAYSHAEGYYTTAQRLSQHVSGEYNVLDSQGTSSDHGLYVEIIGNGTADNARSNARVLDWNGNERLMGDVYVCCNADSTGGNKVVALDSNGKVPSSVLPSYVDDVEEYDAKDFTDWAEWVSGTSYAVGDEVKVTDTDVTGHICTTANSSATFDPTEWDEATSFPATGESGKIYIALDTNKTYRWGGSAYVAIGSDLALGETSSTAYRGDRGAAAYAAAVTNVDSAPATGSTNLVTSGGVYTAIQSNSYSAGNGISIINGVISENYVEISSGTDLNTLTTPGWYSANTPAAAQSLIHCPVTTRFTMRVSKNGNLVNQCIQCETVIICRNWTNQGFSDWTAAATVNQLPSTMTGATASTAGTGGLVPAPAAGDENKVLRGDGTWVTQTQLPSVSSTDNGKVLMVVNGAWAAATLSSATGVSF